MTVRHEWVDTRIQPQTTNEIVSLALASATDWLKYGYRLRWGSLTTFEPVPPCPSVTDQPTILAQAMNRLPTGLLMTIPEHNGTLSIFEVVNIDEFTDRCDALGLFATTPLLWAYEDRRFIACHVPRELVGVEIPITHGVKLAGGLIPIPWSRNILVSKDMISVLARHSAGRMNRPWMEALYESVPDDSTHEETAKEIVHRPTRAQKAEEIVLDACKNLQYLADPSAFRMLMERAYAQLSHLRITNVNIAQHIQRIANAAIQYGRVPPDIVEQVAYEVQSQRRAKQKGFPAAHRPTVSDGVEIDAKEVAEIACENALAGEIVRGWLYTGTVRICGDFSANDASDLVAHYISRAAITGEQMVPGVPTTPLGGRRIVLMEERPPNVLMDFTNRYCSEDDKIILLKPGTKLTEADVAWFDNKLKDHTVITIADSNIIGSASLCDRFAQWSDFVAARHKALICVCEQWAPKSNRSFCPVPHGILVYSSTSHFIHTRWVAYGKAKAVVIFEKLIGDDGRVTLRAAHVSDGDLGAILSDYIIAIAAAQGGESTTAMAGDLIGMPPFNFKVGMRHALTHGYIIPGASGRYFLTESGAARGNELLKSGLITSLFRV